MRGGLFIILLLLVPQVHALALSYEYLEGNILRLSPGQTYYYRLNIQNEQDAPITARVNVESPYATLIGENKLDIPAKTFDRTVYFNISIPDDIAVGQELAIPYVVEPIGGDAQGQVPFSVRYERVIAIQITAPDSAQVTGVTPIASAQASLLPTGFVIAQVMRSGALTIVLALVVLLLIALLWRTGKGVAKKTLKQQPAVVNDKVTQAPSTQQPPTTYSTPTPAQTPLANPEPTPEELFTPEITIQAPEQRQEQTIEPSARRREYAPQRNIQETIAQLEQELDAPHTPLMAIDIRAPQGQEFILPNGSRLDSLRALRVALETMDDSTFAHHVHDDVHDFSNWIGASLNNPSLAARAREAQTRASLREVLTYA